jgi:hypothetical protein
MAISLDRFCARSPRVARSCENRLEPRFTARLKVDRAEHGSNVDPHGDRAAAGE